MRPADVVCAHPGRSMWAAFDDSHNDNRRVVRASDVAYAAWLEEVGEGIHIQDSSGAVQLKEN